MKTYILFAFVLHATTATLDLQSLKNTAGTKLQTLQTKATETFQQFTNSIDLQKLKQLDVLNVLPTLQYKGNVIKQTVNSLPAYKQRITVYLQKIKSLSDQDLLLGFNAGLSWPAKRIDDEDAYYAI